jgi:hypothetical protein
MEQRLAIKFCFKAGKSPTETLQMVDAAYGDQALSCLTRCMGQKTSPRPKKLGFHKSRVKTMLVIFFDWQGVIHKEFVPEGETINAVYYKGVMELDFSAFCRTT